MVPHIETLRFLLVEDHEFQLQMLERCLRLLGATQIRSAGNGSEAMRILREAGHGVDIVISDMKMPEVDGIELIPMLRRDAPGTALLLASAEAWALDVGQAIARAHHVQLLGAVHKPLTPAKLLPLLAAFVAGRTEG